MGEPLEIVGQQPRRSGARSGVLGVGIGSQDPIAHDPDQQGHPDEAQCQGKDQDQRFAPDDGAGTAFGSARGLGRLRW